MFEQEYKNTFSKVTASQETYRRVMHMAKKEKKYYRTIAFSKVLAATMVVTLLVVTASASGAVRSWFASYFTQKSEQSLSQEQMAFIEDNEKVLDVGKTQNEWLVELHSAISDGMKGYIMLRITGPENADLSDIPKKATSEYYGPGNDFLLKSPDAALSCSAYPDFCGVPGNIGSNWQEDGDGRNNTVNYVIDVAPDIELSETNPFHKDVTWKIHFENLVHGFPNQTVLAEGIWDIEFSFDNNCEEKQLITEPFKTRTWVIQGNGVEFQADVTLTSLVLRPFGVTVYYGDERDGLDYSRTSACFTSSLSERTPWFAVMKDGSKIELSYANGNPNERYQYLVTDLPMVIEDIDHILLADGTKISVPD